MAIMERFLAYAQDFERTYKDDDWSRLTQYFAPDAVYEVRNTPFDCSLKGPDAILRGIKRSLDNFDRRFAVRKIDITSPPEVDSDTFAVSWRATYERPGAPQLTFGARTRARFVGDHIAHMSDTYDVEEGPRLAAWRREHGADVDPSYA